MQCFEYDNNTGKIIGFYNVTEEVYKHMKDEGRHILKGIADPEVQYVDVKANPPAVIERPTQTITQDKTEIAADGEDLMTLSSLPIPCEVSVGDNDYVVDDGIFEWGTLERGIYPLLVEAFPYVNWYGTVRTS